MKKKNKTLAARISEAQNSTYDVPLFVLDLLDDLAYRIRQLEESLAAGRNLVLDEAIAACKGREQDARSRIQGVIAPLQVNVLYLNATEARDCAEAIAKLKGT